MSEVYGSSAQVQHSEGVPLQQKLLVCTLLLLVKTGKFKEVQLGKVGRLAQCLSFLFRAKIIKTLTDLWLEWH